jgi:hypothetical protein
MGAHTGVEVKNLGIWWMWIIKFTFRQIYERKSVHATGTGGRGGGDLDGDGGASQDHRSEFQMEYTQFPGASVLRICIYLMSLMCLHSDSQQVHIWQRDKLTLFLLDIFKRALSFTYTDKYVFLQSSCRILSLFITSNWHKSWITITHAFFFFWRNSPQWDRASSFTMFLDHKQRHTTVVGHLWTSDQLVAETSTWQHTQHSQQTDIHAPGGIRNCNPSKRAAADLRLIPRGHWDHHYTRTEL